jgi:3-deoxy-D-manno-octulosonate 8-phosphate phosphatase (KDO 8-P phosphatase)
MIELVVLDIDGIMTDGKKYYTNSGDVYLKTFCDKDWTSIKRFNALGIKVIFISGDSTVNKAVSNNRNIDFYLSRNIRKEYFVSEITMKYNVSKENICYYGDDLFDIGIMKEIGYSFCTKDSPLLVKKYSNVLDVLGGNNAVLYLFEHCEQKGLIPLVSYEEIMSKIYELDKLEIF